MAYLETLDDVKEVVDMPSADIDAFERSEPGKILKRARRLQGRIDAQLKKRYPVPFAAPVPDVVMLWMGALLTPVLYRMRGVNPSDEQQVDMKEAATQALADIEKAANAVDGLFDLPLRKDTTDTGIEQPTTLAYSEQSPYTGKHLQADAVQYNRRYG